MLGEEQLEMAIYSSSQGGGRGSFRVGDWELNLVVSVNIEFPPHLQRPSYYTVKFLCREVFMVPDHIPNT